MASAGTPWLCSMFFVLFFIRSSCLECDVDFGTIATCISGTYEALIVTEIPCNSTVDMNKVEKPSRVFYKDASDGAKYSLWMVGPHLSEDKVEIQWMVYNIDQGTDLKKGDIVGEEFIKFKKPEPIPNQRYSRFQFLVFDNGFDYRPQNTSYVGRLNKMIRSNDLCDAVGGSHQFYVYKNETVKPEQITSPAANDTVTTKNDGGSSLRSFFFTRVDKFLLVSLCATYM